MKKLISLFISLVLVAGVFAQNNQLNVQKVFRPHSKVFNLSEYSKGKVQPYADDAPKSSPVLSEGFEESSFPPTGWTKTTTDASYTWMQGSNPHSGTKDAEVLYDPSLAQQNEILFTPSVNLTSLSIPMLNFWFNMSYYWSTNYTFNVRVSPNGGTSWTTIWNNDSAGVFADYTWIKESLNLTAYDTCTNFKVSFQYIGSNGASLDIDDISIANLPNNELDITSIYPGFVTSTAPFLYDGYSQIPLGQSFAVSMAGWVKNSGLFAQTNVALHLKEITSGATGTSTIVSSLASMMSDSLTVDSFYTISNAGTYGIALSASSDSLSSIAYPDTFAVVVNTSTNGLFSRDNNYFTGNANWNGIATTGTSVNAFQLANLYEITSNTYAKSISVVIASGTTVNAPIKAVLYQGWSFTDIAESDYHFIQPGEIASTTGSNPTAIEIYFNSACPQLYADSVYFVAIQAFGGTDTVLIASGSTTPQPNYTMWIYDTDNNWYYYNQSTTPSMIRLNTNLTDPTGISKLENSNSALYQNIPNPANNTTRISYELAKPENTTLDIYDLTGRKVMTIDEGFMAAGIHSIDINLNKLSSGTYFYTLRTNDFTSTKKMIVKK